MSRSRCSCATLLWLVAGCADIAGFDGNPQMDPGQDCLACHGPRGSASGLAFNAGGTLYAAALPNDGGPLSGAGLFGAEIELTDSTGRTLILHTNGIGNFYTAETLIPPLQAQVRWSGSVFQMRQQAPSGACNACHALTANPDGTLQTVAPPYSGFSRPPGHLYALAGGCASAQATNCPPDPPSYSNQVAAIVEGNCFPCHAAGGTASNWLLENVDDIRGVGTTSNELQILGCKMPLAPAPPMSPEELSTLVAWLACGAPNN